MGFSRQEYWSGVHCLLLFSPTVESKLLEGLELKVLVFYMNSLNSHDKYYCPCFIVEDWIGEVK